MNIKSDTFKFFGSVILVAILLFSYQINNHILMIILFVCAISVICHDTYRAVIKKEYKFMWVIVIYNLIFMIICFVGFYLYISNDAEFLNTMVIGYKFQFLLLCIFVLNSILRMNRFKR